MTRPTDPTVLSSSLEVCVCVVRVYRSALAAQTPSRMFVAPLYLFWLVHPQATLRHGHRTADHPLYDSLTECFTKNLQVSAP